MCLTHCKVCGVGGCSYLADCFYLAVNKACKGVSIVHNGNSCGSQLVQSLDNEMGLKIWPNFNETSEALE